MGFFSDNSAASLLRNTVALGLAPSSGAGHYQWDKGCVLNFSNSLIVLLPLSYARGVDSNRSSVVSGLRGQID